jgi:glutamine synthetase
MDADRVPERLVFVGTSDLAGHVRGKSFPESDLPVRLRRGVGITHSNLMLSAFGPILATPFGTTGDLLLVPDETTRASIPMADGSDGILMLGDFLTTAFAPWACCPRGFLKRGLAALLAETGLAPMTAFEQEFVYTGVADEPGAPYSLGAFRRQGGFGAALLAAIRAQGITPDSFLAEYGPRQFELTIAPALGLAAADEAVITRELTRAVAARYGHRAILAPMLTPDGIGNGTHVHLSLWDREGRPALHDPSGVLGLSHLGEMFVAGLLHHTPMLTALTAPSVASYHRLKPGRWAPSVADLGVQDRGSSLRICPVAADTPEGVARQFNVEFRVADATASPYLALGALVWAGLDGIRQGRNLSGTPGGALPDDLPAALDLLAASAEARSWMGPELHDVYLMFKRAEAAALDGLDAATICDRYAATY